MQNNKHSAILLRTLHTHSFYNFNIVHLLDISNIISNIIKILMNANVQLILCITLKI